MVTQKRWVKVVKNMFDNKIDKVVLGSASLNSEDTA